MSASETIYNRHDKVFAKVRGHPPWPAVVIEVNHPAYQVYFYGTSEVAVCKSDHLCYYLENREKIIKDRRRPEYLKAIELIDDAIVRLGGSDGSTENVHDSNDDVPIESPNIDKSNLSDLIKSLSNPEDNASNESAGERVESQECSGITNEAKLTINDITVIPKRYLLNVKAYFMQVKKDEELYRCMSPEPRPCNGNEYILVKLPCGKFVGLKYKIDQQTTKFDSEYDRAEYDYSEAKDLLKIKAIIESGQIKPEWFNICETNLDVTEEEIRKSVALTVIKRKRYRLKCIETEYKLSELDVKITKSLGLNEAYPERAISYLKEMLGLEVQLLMLIKNPRVFDLVKKLRLYVGNPNQWNLTNEENQKFEEYAEKIREIACCVYKKFVNLLGCTGDRDPWEVYLEKLVRFKELVKEVPECIVYSLRAAPYSRAAFFDKHENAEEISILLSKLGDMPMWATKHLDF